MEERMDTIDHLVWKTEMGQASLLVLPGKDGIQIQFDIWVMHFFKAVRALPFLGTYSFKRADYDKYTTFDLELSGNVLTQYTYVQESTDSYSHGMWVDR